MHREGHPGGPAGSEEVKDSRCIKTNSSVWEEGKIWRRPPNGESGGRADMGKILAAFDRDGGLSAALVMSSFITWQRSKGSHSLDIRRLQ